jgi:hypothetical protein
MPRLAADRAIALGYHDLGGGRDLESDAAAVTPSAVYDHQDLPVWRAFSCYPRWRSYLKMVRLASLVVAPFLADSRIRTAESGATKTGGQVICGADRIAANGADAFSDTT